MLLFAFISFLGNCGDESPTEHSDLPQDGTLVTCNNDPRLFQYSPGETLEGTNHTLLFSLSAIAPDPPNKGNNTWRVRITDYSNTPLANANITVKSSMPDHGHSSTVTPRVMGMSDGTYQIESLQFFMRGIWRVQVKASEALAGSDSADFFICVAG